MRISVLGLLPGTDYAAQVRSKVGTEVSEWSPKKAFTTIEDSVLPKVPTNVVWQARDGYFHGEWDKVTKQLDEDFAKVVRYDLELEDTTGTLHEVVPVNATDEPLQKYNLTEQKMQAIFNTYLSTVKMRVRAVTQNANKSAWSTQITASFATPDPPTNAVVTPLPLGIKVAWTPPVNMNNVSTYVVRMSLNADFSSPVLVQNSTATEVTYMTDSQHLVPHYFRITSRSKTGIESAPLACSGTPMPLIDSQPPAIPGGLTGTIVTDANGKSAKLTVNWTLASPPTDLAGFRVHYKRVTDTAWQLEMASADMRTVTVNVFPYVDYNVMVKSYDNFGNSSDWAATITVPGGTNTAPAGVTGLAAKTSVDSILYTWDASPDADVSDGLGGYDLQISTNSSFPATTATVTYRAGTNSFTAAGLNFGTLYYARVRAVDSFGLSGAWSSTVSSTTTTPPVTPLSDGNPPASSPAATVTGGIGYLHISWPVVSNNDPVTYEVHLSTTAAFVPTLGSSTTKIGEVAGTVFVAEKDAAGTSLGYGTTYYVRILAKDRDTTSGNAPTPGTVGSAQLSKVSGLDSALAVADIPGAQTSADVTSAINSQYTTVVTPALNNRNKITYSPSAPGAAANTAGDTWFVRASLNTLVTAVWEGLGGTSWLLKKMDDATIANINAGTITAGSTFTQALNVKSIFTLGDATTAGAIQSYNYNQVSKTGFALSSSGLEIWQGKVVADALFGGTFTGGTFIVGSGGILRTAGSEVTLTSSGITVTGAGSSIQADAITGGNITASTSLTVNGTITVANSGWMQSTGYTTGGTSGYRLSATGLDVKSGTISAGALVTGSIGAAGAAGLTLTNGSYIQLTSGYIKGGGYTGTAYNSVASTGFYFGSDGLRIGSGSISISGGAISGDTIYGTNFNVNSGGSVTGFGFSMSSAGLTISSGTIGGILIESNQIRSSNWNGSTIGWMINSSGATFNAVTVRGTIESANIIGTTTITSSGVLRTAASGQRLELVNNASGGEIDFYNTTGAYVGTVKSSGGAMYLEHTSGNYLVVNALQTYCGGDFKTFGNLDVTSKSTFGGGTNITSLGVLDLNFNNITQGGTINTTDLYINTTTTTTNAINTNLNSSSGRVLRSTASSKRYKTNIRPLGAPVENVLELEPVMFNYIPEHYSNPDEDVPGFIAEQAESLGLTHLVEYMDGRVETFRYDRLAIYQQVVIRHQQEQINDLSERLARLEA